MKKVFIGTVIAFFLIFSGLVFFSLTALIPKSVSPVVKNGKGVWQKYGCTECHTLFGNGGYNAPDLTMVYQTRGKKWLSDFFARPPIMRPGKSKRHLALNQVERGQIIQFLSFVAKQERLGWPPVGKKSMPGRSRQSRD